MGAKRGAKNGRVPQAGRPFDVRRREAFLGFLRSGMALRDACKRARVSTTTVYSWLDKGRSGGGREEHVAFVEAFAEAEAELVEKAHKKLEKLMESADDEAVQLRSAAYILKARDPRYSEAGDLKRKLARVALEQAEIEREMMRLKYNAAVEALDKGGDTAAIFVGLEALLDPRSPISAAAREEIRKLIASGAIATLAARDLGDPDDKPDNA